MGLTDLLARAATTGVHVLIVEIPGYTLLRMCAEAAITARGWTLAAAPADADALLVCGDPPEPYTELIDAVWNQLPGPRHHATVTAIGAIAAMLDAMPVSLRDGHLQAADARRRPTRIAETPGAQHDSDSSHEHHEHHEHHDAGMHQHGDDSAEPMDMGDMDAGMDMSHMDMGGMDMHMDMSGPAGIPLASGDDSDQDGLEMDVTHLTLGPVLPDWPAGLIVECTLHGDMIAEATIERMPGRESREPVSSAIRSAELCDGAGRLLAVAGWDPVAARVYRVRDELLTESAPSVDRVRTRLARVAGQVARSRTLRWSLARLTTNNLIDARARLLDWIHTAVALLADNPRPHGDPAEPRAARNSHEWPETLDDVRQALTGQELSAARLLIASIPPAQLQILAAHAAKGEA